LNTLDQSDPNLVSYIQRQLVVPAAPANLPYNLKKPNEKDGSQGQLKVILEIFKQKVIRASAVRDAIILNLYVEKWNFH
jgi:hypothetical protein